MGAGRGPGPVVEIREPVRYIGQQVRFEATVDPGDAELAAVAAFIEQDGVTVPIFSLSTPDLSAPDDARITQETDTRIRISRSLTRDAYRAIAPGPAAISVTATGARLFGLRESSAVARRDVEARFAPPRLTVASTFHYVNHGGAELVLYRVDPPDAESGVRVGDRAYRGHPASAAGVDSPDDSLAGGVLRAAARPGARCADPPVRAGRGRERSRGGLRPSGFPAPVPAFAHPRQRPVPRPGGAGQVAARSEAFASIPLPPGAGLLEEYLALNGPLRRLNAERIRELAADTAGERLWSEPFRQLANSQVESGFGDHRTYVYEGREIDQQVHLGFDLSVTANVPVVAANAGRVVWADYLGIYGNCVIVDHGLGLQSLYAHLSSIGARTGDAVAAGRRARAQRHDRARRRRSSPLRDAPRRRADHPGRVVGPALDRGSGEPQAARRLLTAARSSP